MAEHFVGSARICSPPERSCCCEVPPVTFSTSPFPSVFPPSHSAASVCFSRTSHSGLALSTGSGVIIGTLFEYLCITSGPKVFCLDLSLIFRRQSSSSCLLTTPQDLSSQKYLVVHLALSPNYVLATPFVLSSEHFEHFSTRLLLHPHDISRTPSNDSQVPLPSVWESDQTSLVVCGPPQQERARRREISQAANIRGPSEKIRMSILQGLAAPRGIEQNVCQSWMVVDPPREV